jgi:hypothetical protein
MNLLLLKIRTRIKLELSSFWDFILFYLRIRTVGYQFKHGRLNVIFLGENMPPRIARMLKWLKRNHAVSAVLVCHELGYNPKYSNESFEQILLFRNHWHLKRILREIEGAKLIHAFGPKSFYPDVARLFRADLKFVYDMQDILAIYFGLNVDIAWYQKEFPHERNCLAKADGLVSHGLEPIPAYRIYKIQEQVPKLFFPLYCDDDIFVSKQKSIENGEIHLVYAGEIQNASRDKKQFGNIQFHDLIAKLSAQKIHFHVYPAPSTNPLLYNEYLEVAKQNSYFHLEKSVAQTELAKELSKYHFGLIPFFKTTSEQSGDKYRYSTALKLFNFIEAGIPVICSEDITFQAWMVTRHKAGFSIAFDELTSLRNKIEALNYPTLVDDLLKNRNRLSLNRRIQRLYDFYNTILNNNSK